jgi:hypothetical protein
VVGVDTAREDSVETVVSVWGVEVVLRRMGGGDGRIGVSVGVRVMVSSVIDSATLLSVRSGIAWRLETSLVVKVGCPTDVRFVGLLRG